MKQTQKKILQLVLLLTTSAVVIAGEVAPYIQFRSVGRNTARKIVGLGYHQHLFDMGTFYGTFSVTPAYERSFRTGQLADMLFGSSLNDDHQLTISGSAVAGRDANRDWLADQFFLDPSFRSTIDFAPRVQNFLADFQFYMALDEWMEGLYFRIYGPVVHTRYDLNAEEGSITTSTAATGLPAGQVSPDAVPSSSLNQSALAFFQGENPLSIPGGSTVERLNAAKWRSSKDKQTSFGELRAELGWNFLLDEDYHLGLNIQAAAPTGHRPTGEYLFEAQTGNGKHWELGAGLTSRYTLWRSCDGCQHFDFYLEADVTHLFKAKQRRTFDLKGRPMSRYMLAQRFTTGQANVTGLAASTSADPLAITPVVPNAQATGTFAPVANFSTRDVNVDVNVQADIVAMFNYTNNGWSADLGYNFWYKGSESIELRESDSADFERTFGLVGTAQTVGFDAAGAPVFLSATQSTSTITGGSTTAGTFVPAGTANIFVDNARLATDTDGTVILTSATGLGASQIATSLNPVLIDVNQLDLQGTKDMSHKIFTHVNYTWMNCGDWIPYVGLGFSAEFGHRSKRDDDNNVSTTTDTHSFKGSLSKWALELKAGVSFD